MFPSTKKKIWFNLYTIIVFTIFHFLPIVTSLPFIGYVFREDRNPDEFIPGFLILSLCFLSAIVITSILLSTMTLFVKKTYRKKLMWFSIQGYLIVAIIESFLIESIIIAPGYSLSGYQFFAPSSSFSSHTFLSTFFQKRDSFLTHS